MSHAFSPISTPGVSRGIRWVVFAVSVVACLLVFHTVGVHAHEENGRIEAATNTNDDARNSSNVPDDYVYTVEECNNMTLLVRRSLQLFDDNSDNVSLSEAQIIYAETHITRELGARDLIYPGETIVVDRALVERYAQHSQNVPTHEIQAWQTYAELADFALTDIMPQNTEDTGQPTDDTSATRDNEQTPDVDENTNDRQTEQPQQENGVSEAWPWLLLGAGTVALLWYALWREPEN